MSVAVYKSNSGHLQGHREGARHTQAHRHTNEDSQPCIWSQPANKTASYVKTTNYKNRDTY